ncbi:MAG: thiolase C-terminal domain-containing protein [Anaerolineales bacterium]
MTDVVIAGIGQTPVGEHWDTSLRELSLNAIEAAIQDSGGVQPQALFVSNLLAPTISGQAHLGALIADFAGLTAIEAVTVEGAGASGGLALRQAYMMIAAGAADAALVCGVEKLTDKTGSGVEAAISTAIDSDYEAVQGLTPTAQAALLMRRYIHEFEISHDNFAGFPLVAHANGVSNPNAMFRRAIKVESYQRAGIVSDPLNMFDVAPGADGSAALLLTRRDLLPASFSHPLVRVSGSSSATDTLALHDRPDPLTFQAARLSAQRACRQAGILPADVDLFELFDAFSIYAALSLEAAGFAERGQGWKLAQDGALSLEGSLPISTFGGLKARGNPGGATGVYQVVEAVLQLREEAGDNQVAGARRALVQSLGGPASSAAAHVLERMDG